MTDYRARAWREDPWWVIEVEGVGATQAKTVDKIDHMARALVADVEGVPYDEVGITVHIDLPDAVAQDVRTMKETSARAADLTREAARLQREVATWWHHTFWCGCGLCGIPRDVKRRARRAGRREERNWWREV